MLAWDEKNNYKTFLSSIYYLWFHWTCWCYFNLEWIFRLPILNKIICWIWCSTCWWLLQDYQSPRLVTLVQVDGAQNYWSHVPISTSFDDTHYHHAKNGNVISNVIFKAAGTWGTFPTWNQIHHTGFLIYIGKRSKSDKNLPSPSKRPQHHSQQHGYWYYKNTINHTYWPKTLHIFNDIARSVSHVPYFIYKHLQCLYNERSSLHDNIFCRFLIVTINFSCSLHCDDKDVSKQNKTEEMVTQLNKIKNHSVNILFGNTDEVKCVLDSVLSIGFCVPTTWCYQIIKKTPKRKIEVIQFFC